VGPHSWNRWARACAWGGVALYAAFVLAAPVLHHHGIWHQTSPTHCQACVASVEGIDVPPVDAVAAAELIDAGAIPDAGPARPSAARVHRLPGRAPPASSC